MGVASGGRPMALRIWRVMLSSVWWMSRDWVVEPRKRMMDTVSQPSIHALACSNSGIRHCIVYYIVLFCIVLYINIYLALLACKPNRSAFSAFHFQEKGKT